jgi:hypothetical protein
MIDLLNKDMMYGTHSMHGGKYMYTTSFVGKLQEKKLLSIYKHLSEHISGERDLLHRRAE